MLNAPTLGLDEVGRRRVVDVNLTGAFMCPREAFRAELPLDANVLFMTVMATDMPFVGRG